MRGMITVLACCAAMATSAPLAAAVDASPFAGTWKLNITQSRFHPGPPPREVTRTYRFDGDMVSMTINGTRADGSIISARAQFRLDNKDYPYTGTSPLDTVAVTAANAHTWTATARKKGSFLSRSTFTVSPDGRTLTQKVQGVHSDGKAVDDIQVYERQ